MKTTQLLTFVLLAVAATCYAQQQPGAVRVNVNPAEREAAIIAKQQTLQGQLFGPTEQGAWGVPAGPVAEAVSDEIQDLARGLENEPLRIFNYVHDHIRHVLYFGSKKGAQLTLLEKSGNDFDQCALLVALLRAAGHTNVAYQFGWMKIPYESSDHQDLRHWLQLSLSNTNWSYTSNYLNNLVYYYRGYPARAAIWDTNTFAFQRLWVRLTLNSTNYYLDPSFKVHEAIDGINLQTATGFNSNSLMSAAGGTDTGDSISGMSEAAVRTRLTTYTTNLVNYIQTNCPNASVLDVIGGWRVVPSTNTALSQDLLFPTYEWSGQMPILTWANQPTNLMSALTVKFSGTNWYRCLVPQLRGQRLTVTFDSYGLGQLWLDDTAVAQASTGGSGWSDIELGLNHPVGYWDTNGNSFVDTTVFDQSTINYYNNWLSTYNLIYGFEPDWDWLQWRQAKLDAYRQQGLAEDSRQVMSETLNVMGLSYLVQTWHMQEIAAAHMGILCQYMHQVGRLSQELGLGYYFDMMMWYPSDIPSTGLDVANQDRQARFVAGISYFDSAFEHGVIEQLQSSNLVAASTVKMLQLAVTNGEAIYVANSTNWTSGAFVRNRIYSYSASDYNMFDNYIASGATLLLPANGDRQVGGVGSWSGYGFVLHTGPGSAGMFIPGSYYGGQVSDPNATANPAYVASAAHLQPWRRPFRVCATGADPVDMASGAFQVEHTDLSLGQAEPRGISVGRHYTSRSRRYNQPGMAPGWSHNYLITAQEVAAPAAGLGGTIPAQAAPMIAAVCAAFGIYNDAQQNPKNWAVTALITKWATDQINKKGVSVSLGKDTLQFVQQPNGVFTPPANCTWSLTKPSGYVLQERHGNTFKFDALGRLTNIVDQYAQPLRVSYVSASSYLPQSVNDWKGRSLTFNYASSRLTSISDNTGRSVSFGYTGNDLTSVTDPENKTSSFLYDTDHQIIAVKDALNQLVTTNIYDPSGSGRVYTQYTQGNTNKTWRIYWSGWETVLQDPAGAKQRYFYDDANRLVGFQDALGNLSQTFFDGQDHLVMTVSPLNETNRFAFDKDHNLLYSVDPLGFTNRFAYNAQNKLTQQIDPRGNTNRFGYNAKFQLTGITNGASDWVSLVFNATDGTLSTRTDPGGTITYNYDSKGLLNRITYPGGLGSEGFLNNDRGDVLSHTNARQFVTSFQYNLRRELTNTIAPTNVVTSLAFDAVGNLQRTKDARGFSTTNTWSATRKLLATAFPSTPQGTPIITNVYDNRDWLSRTLDPLQQATLFTNDVAGRLLSVTDPLLRTSFLKHDGDGRKTATTNAAQEVTSRQWNPRGELTRVTDHESRTVLRGYDPNGNQTILTNRNGKKWEFQFDAANRLTNTITPLNRQTKQVWDNRGLLQSVTEPSTQTTTFGYDAKARLTNRTDAVGTTLFAYDANNNNTNIVENGLTNSWTLDAYDRVTSYRDPEGNLIQYRRDANGNVTDLIYPGNRTVTYSFDSLNRLTNVTDWAGRNTRITYDLASRLKSITRPNQTERLMNYDAAGQLTNIVEQFTNGTPIAFFKLNFNAAARVEWEFAAPLPHAASLPTRTMTYDDDNRIATFNGQNVVHDLDGNMTTGPLTNNTLVSYTYDARNRLLGVGGLNYAYDPAGNRTAITNGAAVSRFVVNPNAALPQVLMRIRAGVTNYYIYGPGLLYEIAETATSTNTLAYHFDYRGSTVAMTDANGNVTDRIEYSAYATTTYRSGTNDTPFLFNGYFGVMTDANGLLYMRARYYNPYICRFINPDPSGFAGGLNWYAYADGNPISLIDPFGLGAVEGWGGATATWINRHLVNPLNSVSTTSTTLNFASYMGASIIGGLGDMLRVGRGVGYAVYEADNGWDVAIGITEDIQRAAGLTTLVAGGLEGAVKKPGRVATPIETTLNLTKAELDDLFPRVRARQGLAEEVWERSKSPDGKVYDPSGVEIRPGDVWELGHTPGNKFSDAQLRAAKEGWDRKTWREYQNDPDIYRPELPRSNRSHRHESNW